MKITRANVAKYAKDKGLELIQIDGIPEGFAWREPNINISGQEHTGRIIKFEPLAEWDQGITYE